MRILDVLYCQDFNCVGAVFVAVAGDDDEVEVFLAFVELEIAAF